MGLCAMRAPFPDACAGPHRVARRRRLVLRRGVGSPFGGSARLLRPAPVHGASRGGRDVHRPRRRDRHRPGGDRRAWLRARRHGLRLHGRVDGQRRRGEVLARLRLRGRARRAARQRHELRRSAHAGGDPFAHAAAEDRVRDRGSARRRSGDGRRHGSPDDGRRARELREPRRRASRRAGRAHRIHGPARRRADDAGEASRRLRPRRAEPAFRPSRRDPRASPYPADPRPAAEVARLMPPSEHELRLRDRLNRLRSVSLLGGAKRSGELERLQRQLDRIAQEPTGDDIWRSVELARHPQRPYTLDYVEALLDDWFELHGDRGRGDDGAMVTGLGKLDGRTIALVGQQKGRDIQERTRRQFGMPYPEGYRKAIRVFELADRLGFPVVSLVDTPGAYPGVAAEQHGQGGMIAMSQTAMARLTVPTVACVIGEGGSGGAIAIALADRVLMQENAIYSVISPEGCAAILWRDAGEAKKAAAAFKPDAAHCLELGVIDAIVPEPPGGAHTDHRESARLLGDSLRETIEELTDVPGDELRRRRRAKFRSLGVFA